jgi:hypothetical protein
MVGAAPALAQQATQNPHVNLRGLACGACHTTSSWREVSFDHRRTGTPLLGQHAIAPCTGCHDLRDFHTVAQACRFCHQDPHRGDAGTRCQNCHVETGWRQVSAPSAHANTRLPELGVHAALPCADCHRQAAVQQFSGPVTRCVECHQTEFSTTSNPSHASLGFSQQCEACHQLSSWSFALFQQHDAIFPIYSSTHAGRWSSCTTCHSTAADYTVFSCTGCHGQTRTNAQHSGVGGYSWASAACLMCHPDGRAGDFVQHDAIFPIFSGTHAGVWTQCTDCHTDPTNRKAFACTSAACHPQPSTDPWHAGIPGYQFASAQCYSCHPAGQSGTFTQHDQLYFPIYSGTHAGRWQTCATCHTSATQPSVFTCMSGSCHPAAQTNSNHGGVNGYTYTAQACYSCHPRGSGGG